MAMYSPLLTTGEWEQELGAMLRRARLLQDIDQQSLAKQANVSLGALKNLENGNGSTLKTLIKVSRALGKESWLAGLEPEPEIGPMDLLRLQEKQKLPSRASSKSRNS